MPHLITPALHAVVDLLAKLAAKRHEAGTDKARKSLADVLEKFGLARGSEAARARIADRWMKSIDVNARALDRDLIRALHVLVDEKKPKQFKYSVVKSFRKYMRKTKRETEIIVLGGESPSLN